MVKQLTLLSVLTVCLFSMPFVLHAQDSSQQPRTTIEKEESFSINLDSRDLNTNQTSIDLDDFNYQPPEECSRENTVCFESSIITVNVKKVWELATVYPITSEELSPDVFSTAYPEITSTTWEELRTNPQELMIAQRILYERGLMDVLPTGQYGYITELGIAHLQGLKDIEEIDWEKGQVIIGQKTIAELNLLKERMLVPHYFEQNPLPTAYTDVLSTALKSRAVSLEQYIPNFEPTEEERQQVQENKTLVESEYEYEVKPDGSQLQFQGQATIEK